MITIYNSLNTWWLKNRFSVFPEGYEWLDTNLKRNWKIEGIIFYSVLTIPITSGSFWPCRKCSWGRLAPGSESFALIITLISNRTDCRANNRLWPSNPSSPLSWSRDEFKMADQHFVCSPIYCSPHASIPLPFFRLYFGIYWAFGTIFVLNSLLKLIVMLSWISVVHLNAYAEWDESNILKTNFPCIFFKYADLKNTLE